jgi:hypothetical protein
VLQCLLKELIENFVPVHWVFRKGWMYDRAVCRECGFREGGGDRGGGEKTVQ